MNYWTMLSPIYGGIVSLLLGYFIARFKNAKAESKAEREALGALLRNDMFDIYECYRDEPEVPVRIQEEMESLYNAYHGLGFNGTGTKIHNEIMAKPTRV